MVNGKFTAREINTKVQEFLKTQQRVPLLSYAIEKIQFNQNEKKWSVICSFYNSLLATRRVRYTFLVDGETGEILDFNSEEV